MKKRRTLSVLLVVIGLANLIRAGMSFKMNALFSELQVALLLPLGALYTLSGIVFIALAIMCWRRDQKCPAFLIILGYQIIIWSVRLLTFRSSYARSLWPRDALFTLLFLGIVYFLNQKPRNRVKNDRVF